MKQYICFQVGEARYALPLGPVAQVLRFENVTPVPMASGFVEGILNMGGEVVPVINLRLRFGLGRGQPNRRNRVLVVEQDGVKHGLLVDGVKEILELEDASILTGGPPLAGLKAELIAGIAKVREHLVVILEGGRLLAAEAFLRAASAQGAGGREPAGQGPVAEAAEPAEEVQPE
jgi:purine-binding chemotaxis protein CheW